MKCDNSLKLRRSLYVVKDIKKWASQRNKNMKCIYCLKDEHSGKFKSREHIFPRTLGGIEKLAQGMVCDDCNNEFSKLELILTHNTYYVKNKIEEGPQGRHGDFVSELTPFVDTDGIVKIGYIKTGPKPHYPAQIIVQRGDHVSVEGVDGDTSVCEPLIKCIRNNGREIIEKAHKDIKEDSIHLLYHKERVYCFYNEKMEKEEVKYLYDLILKGTLQIIDDSLMFTCFNQNKTNLHFAWDKNAEYRVIGKIFFNYYAKCFPSEIYKEQLNDLRNYIYKNENKEKQLIQHSDDININELQEKYNIPQKSHIIIITNEYYKKDDTIIGFVNLYGEKNYSIKTGNYTTDNNKSFNLFFNDYLNKEEYELKDWLTKKGTASQQV